MVNEIPLVLVSSGSTEGALELHNGNIVVVGSEAWFNWLRDNSSFRFESGFAGENSFTARKHERETNDFWYAYRKVNGKLKNAYLGKTEKLDLNKLLAIAEKLIEAPKQSANEKQLGNGYATQCITEQLCNDSSTDCITPEVRQKVEAQVAGLTQENNQLKLQIQELQDQVDQLKAEHEVRTSVLAIAMENVKSNAASKLIKAVKQAYPELA